MAKFFATWYGWALIWSLLIVELLICYIILDLLLYMLGEIINVDSEILILKDFLMVLFHSLGIKRSHSVYVLMFSSLSNELHQALHGSWSCFLVNSIFFLSKKEILHWSWEHLPKIKPRVWDCLILLLYSSWQRYVNWILTFLTESPVCFLCWQYLGKKKKRIA